MNLAKVDRIQLRDIYIESIKNNAGKNTKGPLMIYSIRCGYSTEYSLSGHEPSSLFPDVCRRWRLINIVPTQETI